MKITELPAYERFEEMFEQKGYSQGIEDDMPIYCWDDIHHIPENLTPGHYVNACSYDKIKFKDVPEEYRTRGFFLHALAGVYKDIVEYVKANPDVFDRQFFKDHIATNYYGLMFELNDFEYMPLEFIDEEMVVCAMLETVNVCMFYGGARNNCEDWFYSVYRRKPEVLTEELYILGARCFAEKLNGENRFLAITPEEYRTPEFYFALCLGNNTPVMEDIPESVLTDEFLRELLRDSTENIRCFSEAALERETSIADLKFWQAAILDDGYLIRDIPLNDERVEYFLSIYTSEDSHLYKYVFKEYYERYLRKKNSIEPKND